MKILITGINGMVASHLADLLLSKGHKVVGTLRWQEDTSNINHIKDKIKLVHMNLNDYKNVQEVIMSEKPDAISHLAAESWVNDSFNHPEESIKTNGIGTLHLLEAVRFTQELTKELIEQITKDARQIHFLKNYTLYNPIIHICSSSEVYGLVKREDIPIKETQELDPANPYACGKVLADRLARMYYTNYGLKTIITRMFTHTSRRRKMLSAEVNFAKQIAEFEKQNKIKYENETLEKWEKRKYVLKHGNLNSLRTWAHVEDACNAYYLILTQPKRFGEVYNIGGIDSKTIEEMLNYMILLSPIKDKIIKQLDESLLRKHDVTLQLPDISKFQKDYPEWKAKWRFEDIVKDVLEGQREIK